MRRSSTAGAFCVGIGIFVALFGLSCSCGGILGSGIPDSINNAVDKITQTMQNGIQTLGDQSSQWQQTLTNLESQLASDANGLETKIANDVHDIINQIDSVVKDGLQFAQESFNCEIDIFKSHTIVALKNMLASFQNSLNYKGINNRPMVPNVPIVCSANPNGIDVAHWPQGTFMILSGTDLNLFSSTPPAVVLVHTNGSERGVPATLVNPMTNYRVSLNVPVMISQKLFDTDTVQLIVRWNGAQVNPNKIAVIPAGPCGGVGQACCTAGTPCTGTATCKNSVCTAPPPPETRTWLAMGCGQQSCGADRHVCGIDFNNVQSEGCWGAGNDMDEPTRAIECCSGGASVFQLSWSSWGCGIMQCPPGQVIQAIDFNATPNEQCWGAGNDMDEPSRRILCNPPATPVSGSGCFWTNWGCGRMECPSRYYLTAIDFNANPNEACWGFGNDFDEPNRRIFCCPAVQ